jgi:hypothetical protein
VFVGPKGRDPSAVELQSVMVRIARPNPTEGYDHHAPASHADNIDGGENAKNCLTNKEDSFCRSSRRWTSVRG